MRVELNNETRLLAVIGDPVGHSLSPLIHNTMLGRLGLNYIYFPVRVPRGETGEWLKAARRVGFAGFNATMPHKTELLRLVDERSPDAERIGAVNTVVLRDGRTVGHNTDGAGFLASLADAGISVKGRRVAVLGAGGAAGAVVLSMAAAGAERITVFSRSEGQARPLVDAAPEIIGHAAFSYDGISAGASNCDLLVNASPLGMSGVSDRFERLDFVDRLPKDAAVCDLIYSPGKTELLRRAETGGLRTVGGLGMLIHQAIFALELFTETTVDHKAAAKLLHEVLEQRGQ